MWSSSYSLSALFSRLIGGNFAEAGVKWMLFARSRDMEEYISDLGWTVPPFDALQSCLCAPLFRAEDGDFRVTVLKLHLLN